MPVLASVARVKMGRVCVGFILSISSSHTVLSIAVFTTRHEFSQHIFFHASERPTFNGIRSDLLTQPCVAMSAWRSFSVRRELKGSQLQLHRDHHH